MQHGVAVEGHFGTLQVAGEAFTAGGATDGCMS